MARRELRLKPALHIVNNPVSASQGVKLIGSDIIGSLSFDHIMVLNGDIDLTTIKDPHELRWFSSNFDSEDLAGSLGLWLLRSQQNARIVSERLEMSISSFSNTADKVKNFLIHAGLK